MEWGPSPIAEPELAEVQVAEPVTGIVLAGGRSERMGRDKAWIQVAGKPMIQWVLDAVDGACQHSMIVSRHAGRLTDLGVPVVEDRYPIRGPLTGLHAGLKAAPTDLCVVVACDLPLVRAELLRYLAWAVGPAHGAVPYVSELAPPRLGQRPSCRGAGLQPLCAAYRRACLGPIEKLLANRTVQAVLLASVVKARIIQPEEWGVMDPSGRSFFNVNYPEDVADAARLLAGSEP